MTAPRDTAKAIIRFIEYNPGCVDGLFDKWDALLVNETDLWNPDDWKVEDPEAPESEWTFINESMTWSDAIRACPDDDGFTFEQA